MKTRIITLLIAITAIVGSASAQEYDRVIELYKGGELIQKYKVSELDSIKFNKEYKYAVSATEGGTAEASATEVEEGATVTLTATPSQGYNFVNWTVNGEVVSTENPYTTTITANAEFVANFEPDPYNGHEYVDLGLSVKWATCNVGATTPEGYGDYFAWGETEPKDYYDWSTYKYCNGSFSTMTKYCTSSTYGTVDNKTTLELTDDAARVNWGGNWRMPTKAERDELRDTSNCTWTWTTQNGVKGYKVTSKKNGNSIFLPAAGYRVNDNLTNAGSNGYYWSSSLSTSGSDIVYYVSFDSDGVDWYYYLDRYNGQSVRAVCESLTPTPIVCTVSVSATEGGTAEASATEVEEGATVTLTATPEEYYFFVNWTVNGEVVSTENPYTTTITANAEFVANFEPDPYNGHEYVDLGLSVKWATCNVGATTPEEYGDYFAWGETSPKTTYTWSTYKYCYGSPDTMTKYCIDSGCGTVDNKTTLELSDDAARVNWGGKWRMPTKAEQDELRDTSNCTWTWTTQNGVKGYKVTSKKNGNSIFLPAAGYRGYDSLDYVGSHGRYWSSSLSTSYSDFVYYVDFNSSSVDWYNYYRYYGFSVRAVCKSCTVSVSATEGGTAEASATEVGEGTTVTLTATPSQGYNFVNWTVNGEVVSTNRVYTAIITSDTEFVANFEEFIPEYVDLGLPSGIKWATCNVGATTPEGSGQYFAWGETSPKTTYTWSTYKYCNGSFSTMTKYCVDSDYGTVDYKTTLELSDDAARVNWGGNWRMPTKAEQDELRDTSNCTWKWTTQNGVKGYKVTSKKNGNSIFLPATGYRINDDLSSAGSHGDYWSSSLNAGNSGSTYYVFFSSSYVDWDYCSRYEGLSVRAVCE